LLAGQMMYRWKMGIMGVTFLVVALTLGGMAAGPLGQHRDEHGALVNGPVAAAVAQFNSTVDGLTDHQALFTVEDPTLADPRIPAPGKDGARPTTPSFDAATGQIKTLPNYLLWTIFLFVFSYLGANLPIWRFAQPVNYIGFWITLITILLSAAGMVVAPLLGTKDMAGNLIGNFALPALKGFGFEMQAGKAWQPLWPMLFVTIACGAISGWHSLVGAVGTARQLEYETDGLPVGAGSMFGENALALLSLTAVSIAGAGGGGGRFAVGVGKLVYAGTFGLVPEMFGTALGFGTFVMIVLTVTQLVFRVMRVTLTEWVGDDIPVVRNMHVSSLISMSMTLALVLTGTWVYLWQMFGASNQLMGAEPARGGSVAQVGEAQPDLRPAADALHVRDHAGGHRRHGAQPVRDDRIESEHERPARGGCMGDDRGVRAPVRGGHPDRVGRLQGVPAPRCRTHGAGSDRGPAPGPTGGIAGPNRVRRAHVRPGPARL